GRGDLTLDLTTTGSDVGRMRRDVAGAVAFPLRDGAYLGIDLWYELLRARAVFERESVLDRPAGPRQTPFSTVSASGVVQDATLTNRDLNATLGFLTVGGQGTVNLPTNELDLDLVATFVDNEQLQSEPLMAGLAGDQLPLKVGGTVTEPTVVPDFAAMVRARVQEEVTERVQERLQDERAQERIEEERSEVEQRLEQEREELRDRLRGILNRRREGR